MWDEGWPNCSEPSVPARGMGCAWSSMLGCFQVGRNPDPEMAWRLVLTVGRHAATGWRDTACVERCIKLFTRSFGGIVIFRLWSALTGDGHLCCLNQRHKAMDSTSTQICKLGMHSPSRAIAVADTSLLKECLQERGAHLLLPMLEGRLLQVSGRQPVSHEELESSALLRPGRAKQAQTTGAKRPGYSLPHSSACLWSDSCSYSSFPVK